MNQPVRWCTSAKDTVQSRIARCLACGRRFSTPTLADKCCCADCYDEWLTALAAAGPPDPELERIHTGIRKWARQRERARMAGAGPRPEDSTGWRCGMSTGGPSPSGSGCPVVRPCFAFSKHPRVDRAVNPPRHGERRSAWASDQGRGEYAGEDRRRVARWEQYGRAGALLEGVLEPAVARLTGGARSGGCRWNRPATPRGCPRPARRPESGPPLAALGDLRAVQLPTDRPGGTIRPRTMSSRWRPLPGRGPDGGLGRRTRAVVAGERAAQAETTRRRYGDDFYVRSGHRSWDLWQAVLEAREAMTLQQC